MKKKRFEQELGTFGATFVKEILLLDVFFFFTFRRYMHMLKPFLGEIEFFDKKHVL